MKKVYSWNGWTCNPGDTVKVWRKVEGYCEYGMGLGNKWFNNWNASCMQIGKECRVISVGIQGVTLEDGFSYPLLALVPPEYFELNQDNKPPKLEPFMRVKTRNGNVYIYCEGNFYGNAGWLQFSDYDENLLQKNRKDIDWDIVEVYGGSRYRAALNCDHLANLIWERKEEDPKLTALKKSLEELEAKASDIKRQIEEFGK